MRHVDLLLSSRPGDDLEKVAGTIFDAIGVVDFEERHSENYYGGYYFLSRIAFGAIEVRVMLGGDTDHQDLPFWLRLDMFREGQEFSDGYVDEIVRSKLIPSGFKVARMYDFGVLTEKRVDY